MKTLANYFKIVPLSDFSSFDGEKLITISGAEQDHFTTNNDLVLNEAPDTENAAGTFYKQSLRAVTDKLTAAQQDVYLNRRPVIVLLYTDDGAPVLWGSSDQKLRVTITPTPNADIIDFNRTSLNSVF